MALAREAASHHAVWKMTEILDRRWCQDTLFSHHAVWDECNKHVHHQPSKSRLKARPKEDEKQNTGRGSDMRRHRLGSGDNTSLRGVCSASWAHRRLIQHLHAPACWCRCHQSVNLVALPWEKSSVRSGEGDWIDSSQRCSAELLQLPLTTRALVRVLRGRSLFTVAQRLLWS